MFFVINKEKIYSFIVALSTVVILFLIAMSFNTGDSIHTSAKVSEKLPIYNVETTEKKVAFTMNAAWNADDIDKILEVLNKTNSKITFFIVGDWVDKYPEAVKKISDNGHEIANHSNTHPHVNNLSLEKNIEEIKLCNDKIEKITGVRPTLYRGPYGEYNDIVISAAENENMRTMQWNLDTLDYSGLTGEQMWKRIENKLSNGSIVLSHNGTKHTADSLEMLINNIKEKGYSIVKVSEIMYKDNYIIDKNGIQKENMH